MHTKATIRQLVWILGLFLCGKSIGQTQTVKGTIKDAASEYPLIGATIQLVVSDPPLGAVTDVNGSFRIENVPSGRQTFLVQYLGYKSVTLSSVLITTGKEVVLDVSLEESVGSLKEVVITNTTEKDLPINELAKVSARTFSIEEVTRYSGGRNDVARLASSFAGVSTPNDSRNDIVVRGNSPTALLWRINGIPLSNVNHFSTLGTTGGPVSALNTNLLKTSDFITGAFPAEYGNSYGAVFDVQFRDGNKEAYEFTAQLAAFTGLEFMAEGPISKEKRSSFVASYRYGIAAAAAPGTSGVPIYQDVAFKVDLGQSKLGNFEVFGMGGTSSIDFLSENTDENDLFASTDNDAFVDSRIGLVGLNHLLRLGEQSFLRSSAGLYTNQNDYLQDNFVGDSTRRKYRSIEIESKESRASFSTQLNTKFSARTNIQLGVVAELFLINSEVRDRLNGSAEELPDTDNDGIPDEFRVIRDANAQFLLLQPYVQGEYRFSDDFSITAGLHGQYQEIANDFVVEPRVALSWQFKDNQRLGFGYGLHSQNVPLPIMFLREQGPNGSLLETNRNLSFLRSNHYILSHDWRLGVDWRMKTEVYYQQLFDIPIEDDPTSTYSVLNEGADFSFDERGSLVNRGTGRNYGLEMTIEKFFSNDYYGLFTTSLFESKYTAADGVERNTAFNNNYVFNFLFGKEWKIADNSRQDMVFTFDTRISNAGGRPFTPIDLTRSIEQNTQVEFENDAFSDQLDPYARIDLKFGYRINSKRRKISHQFYLDLQNITNRQNEFIRRFNTSTQRINSVKQIGFFPDVLYRFQF